MARRLRDVLEQRVAEGLVGRSDELAVLLHALEQDGPRVVWLHGIGGIGKSSLLGAFATAARRRGVPVVELDGRTIEPTERAFLEALGAALGVASTSVEKLAERLGRGRRAVVTIDAAEHLRLLHAWLRRMWLPALGEEIRVVLASREAPHAAWRTLPGWAGLFRALPLDTLPDRPSLELLARHGLPEEAARRVNRFARGHPLSLVLAASTLAERPELDPGGGAAQPVLDELTRLFLAEVEDPLTREALEAACVVRRTTVSLLGAMLPDALAQDAYERLRSLPFVESGPEGLQVHEAVQHAVAAALKARDPTRHLRLRRAAWHELQTELAAGGRRETWRTTADLLYLVEQPVVREAFFPVRADRYAVEPARPEDGPALLDIVARHEEPPAADALGAWWERAPHAFSVVRDAAGAVAGFYCLFERGAVSGAALAADPVTREWCRHLRESPVQRGEQVLFLRRWLGAEDDEAPSPVQAACWLDVKRAYMELRPRLRRVYLCVRDLAPYAAAAKALGLRPLSELEVQVGAERYATALLDFGPGSVDGWISELVRAELGSPEREILDLEAHELVLGERRVPLTRLELALLSALDRRRGKVVSRVTLLDEVWGAAYDGASNVVEVAVRALRRKLGAEAERLETVRGAGYRLRA